MSRAPSLVRASPFARDSSHVRASSLAPLASTPRAKSHSPARTVAAAAAARANFAAGIGLLMVVVLLWTASNFVTQDLFDGGYDKPFLVTYLTTSSFSVYLAAFGARRLWARRGARGSSSGYEPLARASSDDLPAPSSADGDLAPLTTRETAALAALFCAPWFLANWALNAALAHTSVASATILSAMSGFCTLLLGALARVAPVTLPKAAAVGTSFAGVVLVALSDAAGEAALDGERRYVLGDALALLSAFLYALYVILLKVRIRNEARVDMQLFFGFVGAINICAAWPLGVVLHLTGVEPFEWPENSRAVGGLLVNMAITLSSDFIYVLAMLKTSPLVVTLGLSLTMPLAVLGDLLLGRAARAQVVAGAALVLLAFAVVGVAEDREAAQAAADGAREEVEEEIEIRVSGEGAHAREGSRVRFEEPGLGAGAGANRGRSAAVVELGGGGGR